MKALFFLVSFVAATTWQMQAWANDKAPKTETRTSSLGAFVISLPSFVDDIRIKDKGPLHRLNAVVAPKVSFDAAAVDGRGNADELRKFLGQMVDFWQGNAADVELVLPHAGVRLSGKRISKPAAVPDQPRAVIEIYAGAVAGDLFSVTIGVSEPSETNAKLREMLIKTTDAAVYKRTHPGG